MELVSLHWTCCFCKVYSSQLSLPQVKDFEAMKEKAREEELQIAETKMVMHQVSWIKLIN